MIRMGIDLGTNYIRLCTQEDGLLYNEPCMVALDNQNHVLGIGEDAKDLIGTMDSNVRIISPLRENPINFDVLDILLDQLLYEHKAFRMFQKTILLVSYPTSFSKESCDILKEHLEELGAYRVYFEQEIWIAAIGAKIRFILTRRKLRIKYWIIQLRHRIIYEWKNGKEISLQYLRSYNQQHLKELAIPFI